MMFCLQPKILRGGTRRPWDRSSRSALLSPVFAQQANDAKTIVTPTLSAEDQRFYELGFKTLPHREGVGTVTNDMVNRIRDEEGI
jgi:hypothetical protein